MNRPTYLCGKFLPRRVLANAQMVALLSVERCKRCRDCVRLAEQERRHAGLTPESIAAGSKLYESIFAVDS